MSRVLLIGTGRLSDSLFRDLGKQPELAVERHGDWKMPVDGQVVLDARRPSFARSAKEMAADVRRTLEAGAHWIDLSRDREHVLGMGPLDELAKERGRVALAGAGLFPGLVEPFVRARLLDVKRVNEVLIGLSLGSGAAWDAADFQDLLVGVDRTIPMSIGGERTQREFWGDTRGFEHPSPVGLRKSSNADAPDLGLYLERPYRAAGVRLSVALASAGGDRAMRLLLWLHARGLVAEPRRHSGRLASFGGGKAGQEGAPSSVTICVRGIDAKSLPLERRISFQTSSTLADLEAIPARLALRALLAPDGEPLAPGARAAAGVVDELALESFARAQGVTVRRGDLGGWRA